MHDAYGGPAALQRFVDRAHRHGLAVCLDVVYNHLGPDGNYLAQFGPYFTDAHETPWGWAVNLDQADAEGMRRFIIDNALRWFSDFHVDALRLDAVHALSDSSPVHILEELEIETAALSAHLGRPLTLIAESDLNDTRLVTPREGGGYGLDAQHTGRGLMNEALSALLDEAFSPAINLHRVQAAIRPENAASLRVVQRLGFREEGLARDYLYIDGAWRDHLLFAVTNPGFIRPESWPRAVG